MTRNIMAKAISLFVCLAMLTICGNRAVAQDFAIKTNLLSDIALSPNLGVEISVAPRWSIDISGQANFWTVDGRKWKHWMVSPEARYWFCQRFEGHFIGLHALGGQYNFGNLKLADFIGNKLSRLRDRRYQGWGAGAGIGYGYAWPLSSHLNIEAELGVGWIHTRYDAYPCADCGTKLESGKTHNYFGPTKIAVNLTYIF